MIGQEPLLLFRVDGIHESVIHEDCHVDGTLTLGHQVVDGQLWMDWPVVATRLPTGEPMVTLTLRKIEAGKAFVQVTVSPVLELGTRQ
jgi:hypothetical protein